MLCYSHFPHCSEKSSRVLHPLRNHLKKEPLAAFADYLHMGVWPLECVRILRFSSDFYHSTHNRPSDVFAYKTSQFRYGEGGAGGENGQGSDFYFQFSLSNTWQSAINKRAMRCDALREQQMAMCVCACVCVWGRGEEGVWQALATRAWHLPVEILQPLPISEERITKIERCVCRIKRLPV